MLYSLKIKNEAYIKKADKRIHITVPIELFKNLFKNNIL